MEPTNPDANVYYRVDLTKKPADFDKNGQGGVVVPLFADLKRHDMGDALAETFSLASDQRNREFTTARLWGIADSGPYLHDGRATTLSEAILLHGGEAEPVRNEFDALGDLQKEELLGFLRTLETPKEPSGRETPPAFRRDAGDMRSESVRSILRVDDN
jgi:cytochrome c peroxidase